MKTWRLVLIYLAGLCLWLGGYFVGHEQREQRPVAGETERASDDPIIITSSHFLPAGTKDVWYAVQLHVVGERCCILMPVTWFVPMSIAYGEDEWTRLPYGLTLNTTTGVISGRPKETGKFKFWVAVSDSNGLTQAKMFRIEVIP